MCKRLATASENTDKTKLPKTITDVTLDKERRYNGGSTNVEKIEPEPVPIKIVVKRKSTLIKPLP